MRFYGVQVYEVGQTFDQYVTVALSVHLNIAYETLAF